MPPTAIIKTGTNHKLPTYRLTLNKMEQDVTHKQYANANNYNERIKYGEALIKKEMFRLEETFEDKWVTELYMGYKGNSNWNARTRPRHRHPSRRPTGKRTTARNGR